MKLYNSNSGEYKFVMAYPAIEEFALASLGHDAGMSGCMQMVLGE